MKIEKKVFDWEIIEEKWLRSEETNIAKFLFGLGVLKKPNLGSSGGIYKTVKKLDLIQKKVEFKAKFSAEVQDTVAKDKKVQELTEYLITAKRNLIRKVARLVGGSEEFGLVDLPRVKVAWEMMSVELGQETVISKQSTQPLDKDGKPMDSNFKQQEIEAMEKLSKALANHKKKK